MKSYAKWFLAAFAVGLVASLIFSPTPAHAEGEVTCIITANTTTDVTIAS